MAQKPFLVVLLIIAFIALGILGILIPILFLGVQLPAEMQTIVLLTGIIGIGYLIAGYGLYKGATWGWILAATFTILSLIGDYLYASYLAFMIDAAILVLLLLTAKYYGITIFGKPTKPATPTPPPSAPIAMAYTIPINRKRFVRRKHRYRW